MGKSVLAEVLQTPKWRKGRLQKFCKRQNGENGFCRTSANVKKEKMAFAELLQAPKRRKWPLQECCKGLEKLSGVYNTVASISKSTLAATALYRKHPIGIRNPIPASNIRSGEVWRAKPSVYPRPTAISDAITLRLRSLPCIGVHRQEKRTRLG